jgi:hypothetical protein
LGRAKKDVTCAVNVILDWEWFPALNNTTHRKSFEKTKTKKTKNVYLE